MKVAVIKSQLNHLRECLNKSERLPFRSGKYSLSRENGSLRFRLHSSPKFAPDPQWFPHDMWGQSSKFRRGEDEAWEGQSTTWRISLQVEKSPISSKNLMFWTTFGILWWLFHKISLHSENILQKFHQISKKGARFNGKIFLFCLHYRKDEADNPTLRGLYCITSILWK